MSDKPTPQDLVYSMIEAASQAETVADMPTPGTFAQTYGDSIKDQITAENVEVFLNGGAVINLLVQESMLRVVQAAKDTYSEDPESKEMAMYCQGVVDSTQALGTIIGAVIDDLIAGLVEGPAFDREFNGIVANF